MIVATAGHIDHGKTSLVRALTGVDTDRLAEEKRRGMTIDLGFAYLALPGGARVAFVDVPGHERFVRNMIAGVQGIDAALLAVAADDGPMPQTREHLRILELLGVRRGAVALTKVDRVDAARRAAAEREVREALQGTALADSPIVATCAPSGEGLDAIREWLHATAVSLPPRRGGTRFRMHVDRAFILEGRGLVATGTVISGSVRAGDEVVVLPAGTRATVRGLRADNEERATAVAGQRCALNLPGLERDALARGCTIAGSGTYALSRKLDVAMRSEPAAKATRSVQLCLGTESLAAQVSRREGPLARLTLEAGVAAFHGDRFLLRDPGSGRLLGGGRVLDPLPPERMRPNAARVQALAALAEDADPAQALAAMLDVEPGMVELGWFARAWHLADDVVRGACDGLALIPAAEGATFALHRSRWAALQDELHAIVAAWHAEHPDWIGARHAQVLERCGRAGAPLVAEALGELVRAGRLARDGAYLRLPAHRPVLDAADEKRWRAVAPLLVPVEHRPPRVHELAARLKADPAELKAFLERVAKTGLAYQLAGNRFALPQTVADLESLAGQLCEESGEGFTAATFRDRSGLGRNLTIEVLEFLDGLGVTRRHGATRRMQERKRNGPRWDARTSNPSGGV